jgi:His-Xaa-Ser system radical SAM maturase HxsC
MLKLGGRIPFEVPDKSPTRLIFKLSDNANLPSALRSNLAYLCCSEEVPSGFAAYLVKSSVPLPKAVPSESTVVSLSPDFDYLQADDIVRLDPVNNTIRVLFRAASKCNFFLVTEQCNSFCLMCSQPPKKIDDSWILDELSEVIRLIPTNTAEIGFSGGEPFLYGEKFLDILRLAKNWLPNTAVHVLSNGRQFADAELAEQYAALKHPDLMVGIPLYSDDASIHDYVVQATGAFDETLCGILNLKTFGQRVEIRVVLHQQTVGRLPQLAEFIARNLLFVDQVALMGLEITGFTRANLEELWIEPKDYSDNLRKAVSILSAYDIPVSIYNHQLCTVDKSLWKFCRKSISDWKNEYLDVCNVCTVKSDCGGFFSSSKLYRHSSFISPVE